MTYKDETAAKEAVSLYNDNAVDDMVCSAKPFLAPGEKSNRADPKDLAKRVYLMNLPYDAHPNEIERLCREFAPIDKIVIPRDPKGLVRGYAFVYL